MVAVMPVAMVTVAVTVVAMAGGTVVAMEVATAEETVINRFIF
jgi:hypothetical protein